MANYCNCVQKVTWLMKKFAVAAANSLQWCPTLRPHRRQPTRLPHPWDSPGKNTGVGCHFHLQCMKVKSESEVTQSCPTLQDPMDSSLPGSSIHGIFQPRVLEWVAIAFSGRGLDSTQYPWDWGAPWDPPSFFLCLNFCAVDKHPSSLFIHSFIQPVGFRAIYVPRAVPAFCRKDE